MEGNKININYTNTLWFNDTDTTRHGHQHQKMPNQNVNLDTSVLNNSVIGLSKNFILDLKTNFETMKT